MRGEACRRRRRQCTGVQLHHQTGVPWVVGVIEHGVEEIIGHRALALGATRELDGARFTKQAQRLIQQVRAEVIPQAAAGQCLLTPAVRHRRAEAVEVGFQMRDAPQRAVVDQFRQRQEVGIEAPIVKYRQHPSGLLGLPGQGLAFFKRHREGLVDDHMLACRQRRRGQRGVSLVGRRDDDQIDVVTRKQGLRGGLHLQLWALGPDDLGPRGGQRHQRQPVRGLDQGRMEGAHRHAITDQPDPDRALGGEGGAVPCGGLAMIISGGVGYAAHRASLSLTQS